MGSVAITRRDVFPVLAICRRLGGVGDKIAERERARGRCIISIQLLTTHSALLTAPKHNRVATFVESGSEREHKMFH